VNGTQKGLPTDPVELAGAIFVRRKRRDIEWVYWLESIERIMI
jgi:hypothetical protein